MAAKKDTNSVSDESVNLHYEKIMSNNDNIDPVPSTLSIDDLPEWYDEKLFKLGQDYVRRNFWSITVANTMGLLTVFTPLSIFTILNYTGKSSTVCSSFTRYLQTIIHTEMLYLEDISDANSKWWRSLNTIRWKHSTVSKKSTDAGIGSISQTSMVLTQFGFVGYVFVKPNLLGIINEPNGKEGFNHLWRVVGYLLGIADEVNLCKGNVAETTVLCQKIVDDYYVDQIQNMPDGCEQMIKTVLESLWYIDVTLDLDVTMHFWYELHDLKYEKPLGFCSQINQMYKKSIFCLLGVPYVQHPVRCTLNNMLKIILWMARNIPIFAWIRFGRENSKVHMYPIPLK